MSDGYGGEASLVKTGPDAGGMASSSSRGTADIANPGGDTLEHPKQLDADSVASDLVNV